MTAIDRYGDDWTRGWMPPACPLCGWDTASGTRPVCARCFFLPAGPTGPRHVWTYPMQIEIVGTQADCDITAFILRRNLNVAKVITDHPSEVETRVLLYATLVTGHPSATHTETADEQDGGSL